MLPKKTLLATAVIGAMLATAANAETLRWTRSADSLTMDPHSQNEGPTHSVNHQIFDTLIYQDMDVAYQPGLATEWYVKEDEPTVWVFKIREGVTFHEGQSLTADDVAFSIDRARREPAGRACQRFWRRCALGIVVASSCSWGRNCAIVAHEMVITEVRAMPRFKH